MRNRTAEASKAVRKAAKKEQELVRQGKGTRDWTPSQQKDILARGRAYDDNGVAFDGHHMKSVEAYPEYQGDPDNIQFLSKEEHKAAHQGSFLNSSNGYYDPRTGLILDFGEDRYIPCKVVELSDPLPEDIVRSFTKKKLEATNSVNDTVSEAGPDYINPNDQGCKYPFNGETAGNDEPGAIIEFSEPIADKDLGEIPASQDNEVKIPETHNQSSVERNQNRSNQEEIIEREILPHKSSDVKDRNIFSSIYNALGNAKLTIVNTCRAAKEKYIEVKTVIDENPELQEALHDGISSLWSLGATIGEGIDNYVNKKISSYSSHTSYSTEEWLSDSHSERKVKTPNKENDKGTKESSEKSVSGAKEEAPDKESDKATEKGHDSSEEKDKRNEEQKESPQIDERPKRAGRSYEDEEIVKKHSERYHTKDGVKVVEKEPYRRGGKK